MSILSHVAAMMAANRRKAQAAAEKEKSVAAKVREEDAKNGEDDQARHDKVEDPKPDGR